MAPERCCSGYGGLDALILSRSSATMHARITRKRLIAPVWMSLLAGSSPSGRRSVESERTLPEEWSCSKTQWMGRSLGGSLKGSPQGSWVSLACGQAWDFPVLTGLLRDYSTLDSSDHGRADPLWSSRLPVRTTCPTEIRGSIRSMRSTCDDNNDRARAMALHYPGPRRLEKITSTGYARGIVIAL